MQTAPDNTRHESDAPKKLLKNGLDPAEMGRRGALARVANTTPEWRAENARRAQSAMVAKHRKKLLRLSGEAIDKLYNVLTATNSDDASIIAAAKTILDRAGLGPKSSIEIDQEINHTGTINHNVNLLPTENLSLSTKMLIACEVSGWQMPEELAAMIQEHTVGEATKWAGDESKANGKGGLNGQAPSKLIGAGTTASHSNGDGNGDGAGNQS